MCEITGHMFCGKPDRGAQVAAEFIDRGQLPNPIGMSDSIDWCAYLDVQRERVETIGQCSGGCDGTDVLELPNKPELVCPHTMQPCVQRMLQPLIDAYRIINA